MDLYHYLTVNNGCYHYVTNITVVIGTNFPSPLNKGTVTRLQEGQEPINNSHYVTFKTTMCKYT